MRVLVTGAHGFVGSHLPEALQRVCGDLPILRTSLHGREGPATAILDVTDREAVAAAIRRFMPTHVVNLAGLAAPAAAKAHPQAAWGVHVQGALNLANAIMEEAPDCCLIQVGSGLVYGGSAKQGVLDETSLLEPLDDYSVTKAAADLALGALARRGLKCIRLRPFNHTGPGQAETFVVPTFAMQISRIEAGLASPVIRVGNLDAERDFLDVRDVVDAYALAVLHSDKQQPGVILNIASGIPTRIGDILKRLLENSKVKIDIQQDISRLRASDLPRIVGNAKRAQQNLHWEPKYSFSDTLAAVLEHSRHRVALTSA